MGFDIIQQHLLFLPQERPQVDVLVHAINARDARGLARSLRANGELTLALLRHYGMQIETANHQFCSGPAESPQVAALYASG